jgi:hypothetical protein
MDAQQRVPTGSRGRSPHLFLFGGIDSLAPARSALRPSFRFAEQILLADSQSARMTAATEDPLRSFVTLL